MNSIRELLEKKHSLEEIDEFISQDPNFSDYYLWKANHFARNSKIQQIRMLEIIHPLNRRTTVLKKLAKSTIQRIREFQAVLSKGDVNLKEIQRNLELFVEKEKHISDFYDRFENCNNLSEVLEVQPLSSIEFVVRSDILESHLSSNDWNLPAFHKQILKDYKRALEINPKNYVALYHLAEFYRADLANHPRAIEKYTKTLEIYPTDMTCYRGRGLSYQHMREYQFAIVDFSAAIEILEVLVVALPDEFVGELSDELVNRAINYTRIHNNEKAMEDYNRALKIDPKCLFAYVNRGNIFRRKGEFELAIEDYTKALEMDPTDPNSYLGRGKSHMGLGNLDTAIKNFSHLIKIHGKFPQKFKHRGNCFLQQEKFEEAILDFTKGIQLRVSKCLDFRNLAVELLKQKIMTMTSIF